MEEPLIVPPVADIPAVASQTESSPSTITAPPEPKLDDGDHDLFSHYVIGGGEAVMKAAITGEPVTALCGKTWVPSRDPKRYPVCPTCEEIQAGRDPNLIDH